ncbi:hypothetical protein [Psychroserpens mesophilus]|uniref:hypothetical protein n=1 Tax=Psychroserpens mesophilus TaxID=325473 RepID=UPI00058DF17F|nr:hypothetical protein [Psychroserpens mesophilus]
MTKEEKNAEKSKTMSLTNAEFLKFFFFPVLNKSFGFDNHQLNNEEDDRFIKHGFDKKLKEAKSARLYGRFFYFGISILIAVIVKYYSS